MKQIFIKTCILFCILISCESNKDDIVPRMPVNYLLGVYSDLSGLGTGETLTITPDSLNFEYSIIEYENKKLSTKRIAQRSYGNGIILYRKDFDYYIVYDKTCPYKAQIDYCSLNPRNIMPVCKCCGSVFFLNLDGAPGDKSKTSNYLRMYTATLTDNQTKLHISN